MLLQLTLLALAVPAPQAPSASGVGSIGSTDCTQARPAPSPGCGVARASARAIRCVSTLAFGESTGCCNAQPSGSSSQEGSVGARVSKSSRGAGVSGLPVVSAAGSPPERGAPSSPASQAISRAVASSPQTRRRPVAACRERSGLPIPPKAGPVSVR